MTFLTVSGLVGGIAYNAVTTKIITAATANIAIDSGENFPFVTTF